MIKKIVGRFILPIFILTSLNTMAADVAKGRRLYLSNCIQCHNKDPNLKGSLGPELVNTPLEIMNIKVVTGRYPEVLPAGFVPKRKTKVMRAFPQLKSDVVHLHAWIQSMKKK